ncbi:MAG: helix-hairpin-helix domain-containing protein [Gemmatimonadaceae bacterium]|nr:helix-hairpin-helix domain-containing protein [Gemmatimonadaceae bacterium]
MATPAERKALLFLAAVVSLGAGVRAVRAVSRDAAADPAATAALSDQLRRVDSARAASKAGTRGRSPRKKPSASIGLVDLDTSSVALIETLNGIGPALAKRIVADRDSSGPFGSLAGLSRVKGIGPALSAKLAPQVTFSRLPRPRNAVVAPRPVRREAPRKARRTRDFP